ncbi:50S ribosomal protein L35ae [Candidatus Woesearchaeota archaeon]|nr:MAG: 50S ribosomal protein L35ae [Candidatus Woesearchaeota archaeon]
MEGVITSYRRGRTTQYDNQMIIAVNGINSKDKAADLIRKKVVWKSPAGKEIKGEVRSTHGRKGCIRVLFEKGMPGQSLGKKVEII